MRASIPSDEPSAERFLNNPRPPVVFRAVLGLKDDFGETGVNWDGSWLAMPLYLLKHEKYAPETRRNFMFGPPASDVFFMGFCHGGLNREPEPLGSDADASRRSLIDGWLPGVVTRYHSFSQGLIYEQTIFAAPLSGSVDKPVIALRMKIINPGDLPRKSALIARFGWQTRALYNVDGRPIKRRCVQRGNVIVDADRHVILLTRSAGTFKAGTTNSITYRFNLKPGESRHWDFFSPRTILTPHETANLKTWPFENAMRTYKRYWNRMLAQGMSIQTPEPMINNLYRNLLAQCFIAADGDIMYYGAFPSGYDNTVFGLEEGFSMLALAYWGFGRDSERYLTHTYLDPRYLKENCPNRHLRNGLGIRYAYECFRLTQNTAWLNRMLPVLKAIGEWINTERTANPPRSPYAGLLPRCSLGGDIGSRQGYPLVINALCWRGLRDLGLALRDLDKSMESRHYLNAANHYQRLLIKATRRVARVDRHPPFLPLDLADRRTRRGIPLRGTYDLMGDYYQLFAPQLLESGLFGPTTRMAAIIMQYLKQSNRLWFGLPRFWGGVDALYGKGCLEHNLKTGRIPEFLDAFYAYLMLFMDREVFSSEEVSYSEPKRYPKVVPPDSRSTQASVASFSDRMVFEQRRAILDLSRGSEPLMGGAGVILQSLRKMLVMEESDDQDQATGNLLLAHGVPRRWLADGQEIVVNGAITYFGKLSYKICAYPAQHRILITVEPFHGRGCQWLKLKLRHPAGAVIKEATLNGRCLRIDRSDNIIWLRPSRRQVQVVATFRPS